MEYQISEEELVFVEDDALECAERFLSGNPDWNENYVLDLACDYHGYDRDFVWLTSKVLFGPAVVHLATGKTV